MTKHKHGQAKKTGRTRTAGRRILLNAVFQLIAYVIAIVSCAVLTLYSDRDASHDFYRTICALSVAAFCSAYCAARNRKEHGLLTGFLSTLPVHLLLLILSFLICKLRADLTMLFSFVILSLVSMLGGVLAVNHRDVPRVPGMQR